MVEAFSNDRQLGAKRVKPFFTETYAKWIMAGEHAVLRGCPALAFPLTSRTLRLDYRPGSETQTVEFAGPHGEDLRLLFHGVIESALSRLDIPRPLTGHFRIESALPVGAGLGASAALCGAVGRWCESQGWIRENQIYEFSRKLEDLFHGESSGVDLAVSLSAQGVHFVRGGERRPLKTAWWPKLYLSYCGARGMTSDCVNKVKRLFESDPVRAKEIDGRMHEAVAMCETALSQDSPDAFNLLRRALMMAASCFEDWGLSEGDLGRHLKELEQAGAVAVKPTGSGGGGFALSLWTENPPASLLGRLIPVPGDK